MQSGLHNLSTRITRQQNVSVEVAQKIVGQLNREGQVSDVISANRLIAFLEYTTKLLLKAGYKGLLLLPDEFELFSIPTPILRRTSLNSRSSSSLSSR